MWGCITVYIARKRKEVSLSRNMQNNSVIKNKIVLLNKDNFKDISLSFETELFLRFKDVF